ncbi:MAG: YegS/Rv2252/BmrU family lipid kinase [Lachnospiraceae bacterium]|nr:YegS/Rv2252/BmrU family lipid kinase [Lachnospiraceae bacterium]
MYQVIVNPTSSSGKGMEAWKEIKTILNRRNVTYEVHMLQNAGEATQVVRGLTADGNEANILVVGGDGTLNEVLNGIQDFDHTKVSCIQTGSGNDFARNMHLEKNVERAIMHLLEQPEEIALDYGEVTVRVDACRDSAVRKKRFLISSGVGYDANICEEVSRSRLKAVLNKIHLGKLVYVLIGVKQIFAKKTVRAKLYLDDAPVMKLPELFFVVGMNHMYEGGGIPFCPNADPTDGRLDVCLVKGMSRLKLLLAVVLVYFKKHLLFKDITNHRCKKMRLVTETPQWIHMDGETPYKVREITWESKGKLRFVR